MAGTLLTKMIAALRDDGTMQEWDDQRAAAATELQRLAWHIEWVIDHSNDPSVVRECRMVLGLPIPGGHPAT